MSTKRKNRKWIVMLLVLAMMCCGCQDDRETVPETTAEASTGTGLGEFDSTDRLTEGPTEEPTEESTEVRLSKEQQAVVDAEQESIARQNEIWVEALRNSVLGLSDLYRNIGDDKTYVIYSQTMYIPWVLNDEDTQQAVRILHRNSKLELPYLLYEGQLISVDGAYQIEVGSETTAYSSDPGLSFGPEEFLREIKITGQLERFGTIPLDVGSENYEEQCKAAELVYRAAMHYIGTEYLETHTIDEGILHVWMYLVDCNYDLNKPEGQVLIQIGKDTVPILTEVKYTGSCREQIADYFVMVKDEEQVIYQIENALCLKWGIVTSGQYEWIDGTQKAFEIYDEETKYSGEYGVFLEETRDLDGDGQPDRLFRFGDAGAGTYYLFVSNGQVIKLGPGDNDQYLSELHFVDLTGDGQDEILYWYRKADDVTNSATVILYEKTENGLKQMSFNGTPEDRIEEDGNLLFLQKIEKRRDDNQYLYISQRDGDVSMKLELTEQQFIDIGFSVGYGHGSEVVSGFVRGNEITLFHDSESGENKLIVKGRYKEWLVLDWELVYRDGCWERVLYKVAFENSFEAQ